MRLPWWTLIAYAVVKYWYLTIPMSIILALAARYGAPWLGGLRWVLVAAAVLLTLPFPAAAAIVIYQSFDATRYFRTLDADETVAGLPVPAGSKVRYADKTHRIPISIELPHVTEIRGMRITGALRPSGKWGHVDKVWGADLAEDQHLDGLPCRAGPYANDKFGGVIFDEAGAVHRCTLATTHELFGLTLPPGTTVSRGNDRNPWRMLLPADAGVDVPVLATTAPPGVTLSVAHDGRLEAIGSGHGQTIVVRGVPLNSKSFELHGGIVVSELAQQFAVVGEMRSAGTKVRVDLATGNVAVTGE